MGERKTRGQQKKLRLAVRGMLDFPYLILTLLLTLVGLIMIFSASFARAYYSQGNSAFYFARQLEFAIVGVVVMFLISRVDYHLWRTLAFLILGISIVLLMLVPVIGTEENGARRWIYIGVSFQPSEIAKLGVVLAFATLISSYREKMESFTYGVLPFVVVLVVIVGLLALEPHLSAIVIICCLGAVMMFLGGTRWRWFVVLGICMAVGGFIFISVMGYAGERLTAWRDPWADAGDSGYQIVQSLYAIGSGGLTGLGLGRGRQKYLYLPEEHNDYIFSIVCEELGFLGACAIVLLFVLLIVRGYWIALHARDRFGALTAAGLTTLLALQVFFNIGVVTNFLPATGISLPFFSYGGTALLLQLFEMGVVLAISRSCDRQILSVR